MFHGKVNSCFMPTTYNMLQIYREFVLKSARCPVDTVNVRKQRERKALMASPKPCTPGLFRILVIK